MRRLLTTALSAGLGVALAGTLATSPAQAETRPFADARGDVRVVTIDESTESSEEFPPSRASSTTRGDVIRTRVVHSAGRVSVTLRFAELLRRDQAFHQLVLRGSNGQRRAVLIVPDRRRSEGVMLRLRNGKQVCQDGLRHQIDYRADTIVVGFPRHCLQRPARVRVAGASAWLRLDEDTFEVYYDDPFREGGEIEEIGLSFSSAVRRL